MDNILKFTNFGNCRFQSVLLFSQTKNKKARARIRTQTDHTLKCMFMGAERMYVDNRVYDLSQYRVDGHSAEIDEAW